MSRLTQNPNGKRLFEIDYHGFAGEIVVGATRRVGIAHQPHLMWWAVPTLQFMGKARSRARPVRTRTPPARG